MERSEIKKVRDYLRNKFTAQEVNMISDNPEIYEVYIRHQYARDYHFDLINNPPDKDRMLVEIFASSDGFIMQLPQVNGKTQEEYERDIFSGNPPKNITVRSRYSMLVDREGNVIARLKYPLANDRSDVINICDSSFDDVDKTIRKDFVYIRGNEAKLGIVDFSGNTIVPPIFDILKVDTYHYGTTCSALLTKKSEGYGALENVEHCRFIPTQSFYNVLGRLGKNRITRLIEATDSQTEMLNQYGIFNGLVFISECCIVVYTGEISEEEWVYIKKNVDNKMLLTKENFRNIINTMDWDKLK